MTALRSPAPSESPLPYRRPGIRACIRRSPSGTSAAERWRRHRTRSHRPRRAGPPWLVEAKGDAPILAGVGVCEPPASPRATTGAKPGRRSSDGLADPEKSGSDGNRSAGIAPTAYTLLPAPAYRAWRASTPNAASTSPPTSARTLAVPTGHAPSPRRPARPAPWPPRAGS